MTDHKLSFIFYEVGTILCVVAMVLGPAGIENWSVAASIVAVFLACTGIYLAFSSWTVPPRGRPTLEQEETDGLECVGLKEEAPDTPVEGEQIVEPCEEKEEDKEPLL
ncbi:hypothetical protein [Anaeromassilibacillus senegalensis]|uniref:hypothetical protein n=1 Tax=Anaeromassilibacillus senegalensis TaxID=1673717 RepID=UPI000682521C|nr:hypothetical protein [Anaeromassilibacillus senegalensis]